MVLKIEDSYFEIEDFDFGKKKASIKKKCNGMKCFTGKYISQQNICELNK